MRRFPILERFLYRRGGSITLLAGLLVPVLIFVVGMAIDYTNAALRRTKLNAIADSAVLAAVTPSMMTQTPAKAEQAARNFFNAQASALPGLIYAPANLTVSVTDQGLKRTAVVQYTASYSNTFAKILGQPTIALGGGSSSTAQVAPNTDYYLLLDTSPSMAVPATKDGIDWMKANTPNQGGCAFACHQTCPSCDNLGNPGGVDNYALARSRPGMVLRIDLMQKAVSDLMTTAAQTAQTYNATYRAAVYTFDYMVHTNTALTANLATAKSNSANLQILQTYKNSWRTASIQDDDRDTQYDVAMSGINAAMPAPGNGTNAPGDKPQQVLFFVTDGVVDQSNASGGRQQSLMDNGWCTSIKNRGIRIAVIYTSYLPLSPNGWYDTYIAPFQPQIGPTLQSCASPGLYKQVDTGGDISDAMRKLFDTTVATARLTN